MIRRTFLGSLLSLLPLAWWPRRERHLIFVLDESTPLTLEEAIRHDTALLAARQHTTFARWIPEALEQIERLERENPRLDSLTVTAARREIVNKCEPLPRPEITAHEPFMGLSLPPDGLSISIRWRGHGVTINPGGGTIHGDTAI